MSIEKLNEVLGKPRTDRYSASKGITGLRKAQAGYYERRFGVKLNPDTQVVATLGSKEGFANVAQAITAPGDVVLVPNPSYPIHAFGFLMAGGVIRSVPSEPTPAVLRGGGARDHPFDPEADRADGLLSVEPDGLCRDLDFYRDLVAFAKKHEIFILSDLAYAEVYFDDDNPPPSVLQVPGAMDVTVEFTSMSKTFSMAGWRMGFAVGNERIIAALSRVKSYLDYGAFTPVQVAATAALNGPEDCIREMRDTYRKRRDALVESFGRAGWEIPPPEASMFAWAPLPEAFEGLGSMQFATLMVEKSGVVVSPASPSASMARAMSASPWWKTSSASARPPAASAASLKAVSKRCTTWFLSPTGDNLSASCCRYGRTPQSGYCGTRHCGCRSRPPYRERKPRAVGALRPRRPRGRRHRALEGQEARRRSARHRMGEEPAGAGRRSRRRLLRRTDGRRRRSRLLGDRDGAEVAASRS